MYIKEKPFVYGTFRWPERLKITRGLPPPPTLAGMNVATPGPRDTAIEVLREFGANELVGKIYASGASNMWFPLAPNNAPAFPWYTWFAKHGAHTFFDMDGSGLWTVLHFRNESDESGLYVAVALRFSDRSYPWIENQRAKDMGSS
jgi:hypothetical protein